MPSGKQKEIAELRKLCERRGFKVVPSGSGHWRVLDKKGQVVVDENGPLILSGTSSEIRSRDMSVKRLLAAGVLERDPWKPTAAKNGDGGEPESRDAAEERRREREVELIRTQDQERAARTRRVRERFEPILARIGGWEKRGMLAEIGLVAHYFADRLELRDRWTSPEAASENADALRRGATLSANMASLWEQLLDELEAWPDTRVRWSQLYAEARGTQEPSLGAAPPPPTLVAPPATPVAAQAAGSLALRVMFEIGVGRSAADPDRRAMLELGEQILRLEQSAIQTEGRSESDDDQG